MSDIPADWRDRLDLRKELARIDRDRAETQKLTEEAAKFRREPWLIMTTALGALLGALIGSAPLLITMLLKGLP